MYTQIYMYEYVAQSLPGVIQKHVSAGVDQCYSQHNLNCREMRRQQVGIDKVYHQVKQSADNFKETNTVWYLLW